MDIKLSVNNSEKEKIGKLLSSVTTYSGYLREETSITEPEVMINAEDITGFNYAEIPLFNRYYFIEEIISVRSGLWRVKMRVDVLESYASQIKAQEAVLIASEVLEASDYLEGPQWVSKVKTLTDILPFSNGLLGSGEYILITAGG